MLKDWAKTIDLGAFSNKEKQMLRTDLTYKKEMSELIRQGRAAAKGTTCYYCGKPVSSFCNSHSIPAFCLRNIATKGEVLTPNALIDFPLLETEKGVNKAGTFQLICRECDSKIFADYENPDNYSTAPTPAMIAQIALKNALKAISKRKFEIEFFNAGFAKIGRHEDFFELKNQINEMDLSEYIGDFRKAKKAIEKGRTNEYYLWFFERLNYVVPIAFQCSLALVFDFEGNVINDIYNQSPDYKIKNINICVFPLENETAIIMFVDDGERRYRKFIKQFKKLTLDDQLAALTFIMFAYSEDIYFSKSIQCDVSQHQALCQASRTSQDIISLIEDLDALELIKEDYDLNKRHSIPNLLSAKYKLR